MLLSRDSPVLGTGVPGPVKQRADQRTGLVESGRVVGTLTVVLVDYALASSAASSASSPSSTSAASSTSAVSSASVTSASVTSASVAVVAAAAGADGVPVSVVRRAR